MFLTSEVDRNRKCEYIPDIERLMTNIDNLEIIFTIFDIVGKRVSRVTNNEL